MVTKIKCEAKNCHVWVALAPCPRLVCTSESFLLRPQSFFRRPSVRLGWGLSLPGRHCRPGRQTAGALRGLMFAGVGDVPGSWSRRGQVVTVPILPLPVLEVCPRLQGRVLAQSGGCCQDPCSPRAPLPPRSATCGRPGLKSVCKWRRVYLSLADAGF